MKTTKEIIAELEAQAENLKKLGHNEASRQVFNKARRIKRKFEKRQK